MWPLDSALGLRHQKALAEGRPQDGGLAWKSHDTPLLDDHPKQCAMILVHQFPDIVKLATCNSLLIRGITFNI